MSERLEEEHGVIRLAQEGAVALGPLFPHLVVGGGRLTSSSTALITKIQKLEKIEKNFFFFFLFIA